FVVFYTPILLIERLLTDHSDDRSDRLDRVKNQTEATYLLTRPSLKLLKIDKVRWSYGLGTTFHACELLSQTIIRICTETKTREYSPDLAENGEVGSGDHNSSVSAAILKETLASIVSLFFLTSMIALETLLCFHFSIIATEKPTAWITVLQKLQLDPAKYLSKNNVLNTIHETIPIFVAFFTTVAQRSRSLALGGQHVETAMGFHYFILCNF
uniref:Uncharacterized protein n=1 Tax=Strigamia maritima TaxID=126957 RepID=T1JEF8_STRMM